MMYRINSSGFTLMEIMIAVGLVLTLSAVGIPIYTGYISNAKIDLAKQNLNSIYLAELNYYHENYEYFITGTTCGNHNNLITNSLFYGEKLINNDYFNFCIIKSAGGYIAKAIEKNGDQEISIDNLNNLITKGSYHGD